MKRKVLFVIPSLGIGGMERVMSELLNYFSKLENIDCYLILYGKDRNIFYKIPDTVILFKPHFKFNDDFRFWMIIKTIFFLRTTTKRIKPDVILSFGELWNSLVLLSLMGLSIPIFISDRCRPDKSFGFFHDKLRKFLYPKSAGIIAQTQIAKEMYASLFNYNNIAVIGNPVRHINTEGAIREKIIISVGRLISTKNFDRLIDIFAKINDKSWKLVIVGGDANKELIMSTLKSKIKYYNLESNVILIGESNKVDDFLAKSSVFAFTSSSEGFPNVIGEAMSAGLPVVAYNCIAGPSDMIEDGKNGYLIPLFDDEMFEKKLSYLMKNEEVRTQMGMYAIKSINKYSIEKIGDKYYNFMLGDI